MTGRAYNDSDYSELEQWYRLRGVEPVMSLFPKVGFIVPGVAAGFLMQTDTSACILEPFIANPNTNKAQRHEALSVILYDLTEAARDLGYSHVYGFSTSPTMIARALEMGFQMAEESITVVMELK